MSYSVLDSDTTREDEERELADEARRAQRAYNRREARRRRDLDETGMTFTEGDFLDD